MGGHQGSNSTRNDEEPFHRAVVLASQFVVRNPPVLCGAFAVGGQFRFGVDRALRVVVFHPTDAAQVPYVHVQPLEGDACGDDAVELVGAHLGVEQAVAERWTIKHLCLAACDGTVALYCCVVAPQGGGEQVSGEVVARQALQEGGTLGFWSGLRLFQFLLCGLHSGFEGGELGLANALDAQAQGGLLACNEGVCGFVPVATAVFGKGARANGFAACTHAGAFGFDFSIHQNAGLKDLPANPFAPAAPLDLGVTRHKC